MPKSTRELIMAGMLRQGQNSGEICEKVSTDFGANALNGAILQENALKNGQNDTKSAYQKATANERATANARLLFIQEVARLSAIGGREKAIQHICTGSALGTLAEPLASNAATALMARGKTEISRRTLYRWIKGYETHAIDGLLPRRESIGKAKPAPEWLGAFLSFYQKPQHPTVQMAYEQFIKDFQGVCPSIHAVRRQLAKMSMIEREIGRATGNSLLKLRPYKRRDTSELWPTDVYTADGTTLDAEVLHPFHGQPCKPEVTAILDVATRRCVGLSMSFSESSFCVLDALRIACCYGGLPAMFYSDNGPGYVNKLLKDDQTGIFQRLGISSTSSIPGRPQGKGLMERAIKTLFVRAAQNLASYTGSLMDPDAAHKNFKASRKALKEGKPSIIPLWHEVRDILLARIDEYNNTPHRGLPRYRDEAGHFRHYTPNQYWATFEDRGFKKNEVPKGMEYELFMPGVMRVCRNGYVELFGAKYFSDELAHWHKESIVVRYSLMDTRIVSCHDKAGRMICTAERDGNTQPYFSMNRIEAARQRKEKGQVGRIEKKLQKIVPGATIALPERNEFSDFIEIMDSPEERALAVEEIRKSLETVETAPVEEKRPVIFESRFKRYCWLMNHPENRIDGDEKFLSDFRESEEYADMRDLLEIQGIA